MNCSHTSTSSCWSALKDCNALSENILRKDWAMSLEYFQAFPWKICATVNCDYSLKSSLHKKKVFLNELIIVKTENDMEFFDDFRF